VILPAVFGLIWMLKGNRKSRENFSGKDISSVVKAE
jgi:hypothetical protein